MIALCQFIKVAFFLWCLHFQNVAGFDSDILLDACEKGDTETVRRCLSSKPKPDIVSLRRAVLEATPLIIASFQNHLEVVNLLLAHDSSKRHLLAEDFQGYNALMYAAQNGNSAMVARLLQTSTMEQILSPNSAGQTALILASIHNFVNVVDLLLDENMERKHLLAHDREGKTALYWAKTSGHTDILKRLTNAIGRD